ncbi:MAG: DUF4388 domain-containing protein [Oscillochloridaceae bacterium umkhey_bin13]
MALEGTLQDMSLSDLFQVFRMGPKTGVLLLIAGNERGVIYVAEGRVIDAALLSSRERTVIASSEEAVIQMMLWDDASFVFKHDPSVLTRAQRVAHDAEWLVMEGMRRRDDPTRALPYHRITLDTQLQLSPLPSSAESGVSLDVNQWRILSQVSSSPNLRTICDATGIAPDQAIRTVAELMSIGLIEVVTPPPPPKPRPQTPRHETVSVSSAHTTDSAVASAVGVGPASERPQVGRSLLDAIMRRVREL